MEESNEQPQQDPQVDPAAAAPTEAGAGEVAPAPEVAAEGGEAKDSAGTEAAGESADVVDGIIATGEVKPGSVAGSARPSMMAKPATGAPGETATEEAPEGAAAPPADAAAVAAALEPAAPAKPTFDFLKRKDVHIKATNKLPEDAEFELAKAFLQQASERTEMSVYDHLTMTVMRLLETRPANAADIFEAISADVKRARFNIEKPDAPGSYKPVSDEIPGIEQAKARAKFFEAPNTEEEATEEGAGETPDIMDLSNLWEWAGVTLGQEETFILFLSLQRLVKDKPLKSVRLWGKINGIEKYYIVAEAELREGAEDDEPAAGEASQEEGAAAAAEGETAPPPTEEADPTLPKAKVKVIPPLSKEVRTGVNKYVYYVCTFAGGKWTRLPDVIPEKLQIARQILKYFTGDLNRPIISYPAFDGTEAQYLRCQIARISSATVASPAGYYTFDANEGDGDDEEHPANIIINPEFEGVANNTLLNPTSWVHHVPYILPQGRCTWENPMKNAKKEEGTEGDEENEDNEDEPKEDGEEEAAPEPETGPALLSPLSADEDTPEGPAWVARSCSILSPSKFSPITLRSTRWPGAVLVAYNDKFSSIYIGDGHRDINGSAGGLHIPPALPLIQQEFVLMEKKPESEEDNEEGNQMQQVEIVEQKDPTVEEEDAYEAAKKAKEEEAKADAEEEEEEGEPAEEEDE